MACYGNSLTHNFMLGNQVFSELVVLFLLPPKEERLQANSGARCQCRDITASDEFGAVAVVRRLKSSDTICSQCQMVHFISHTNVSGTELGPPQREAWGTP
jgi:hypothetical protein